MRFGKLQPCCNGVKLLMSWGEVSLRIRWASFFVGDFYLLTTRGQLSRELSRRRLSFLVDICDVLHRIVAIWACWYLHVKKMKLRSYELVCFDLLS